MHLNNNKPVQHGRGGGGGGGGSDQSWSRHNFLSPLPFSMCDVKNSYPSLSHDRHTLTHGSSGRKATSTCVGYSDPASLPAESAEMLEFSSSPSPSSLLQVSSKIKTNILCALCFRKYMRVHAGFFGRDGRRWGRQVNIKERKESKGIFWSVWLRVLGGLVGS